MSMILGTIRTNSAPRPSWLDLSKRGNKSKIGAYYAIRVSHNEDLQKVLQHKLILPHSEYFVPVEQDAFVCMVPKSLIVARQKATEVMKKIKTKISFFFCC